MVANKTAIPKETHHIRCIDGKWRIVFGKPDVHKVETSRKRGDTSVALLLPEIFPSQADAQKTTEWMNEPDV